MFTQKTLDNAKDIYHQYCAKIQQDLNLSDSDLIDKLTHAYKLTESLYSEKANQTNNHSVAGKISYYSDALKFYGNPRTTSDKEWYNSQFFKLAAYEHLFAVFQEKHRELHQNQYRLDDDLDNIELQFDVVENQKVGRLIFSEEGEIAEEIFTHLKTNRVVKKICIEETENPNERIDDVLDLLESNSSINGLDIHFSVKINDTKPLERFFKSLTDNMNINHLCITFDDFTGIDLAYVAEMIKSSKSINSFVITVGDFVIDTDNLELLTAALEKNMHLLDMCLVTDAYNDENPSEYELEFDKFDDNISNIVNRNKNFVKQVAKFLVQKFVMRKELSLGKEIKYLKHYQTADKTLLKKYVVEEIESGKIDPSKIELVSDTNIQRYIAENFLKLSMVTKGTHPDEISSEQVSATDDELSFEQISSNSRKRKISDETPGPLKVRKLESSSYLSEEVIAEIASFLGPKNLWHVNTGIVPSIEDSTDELNLVGMGSSIDFETGDISN